MVGVSTVLLGFGVENIGWVILVCGMSLLAGMLFFSNFNYALLSEWEGMDEMGVLMVGLSILVMMISLVSSCKDVKSEGGSMAGGFFISEMVGLVCLGSLLFFRACSWMDFYFFFEFTLVPTFFLILKWGYRPERLQAATYMVIYTVGSSLPLLMGLMWAWFMTGSDNMLLVKAAGGLFSMDMKWPWLFMSLGFIVKLPVYGVHGWLPKAHVEAPLSGSMLLAGVLLKFGGYGIIRFMWFSEISPSSVTYFVLVVAMWGGMISGMVCLCQSDMKSLIAYSSIGHMAMSMGSLLSFFSVGKMSCVCMMFAHGLCSPILFSLAASCYDTCSSRNVLLTKGVLRVFPMFSTFWFIFCILNMGVPPSLNFYSEIFCVGSLVWTDFLLGVLAGAMCLIGGCYCLVLYGLVSHGGFTYMSNSCPNLSTRYVYSALFITLLLVSGGFYLDLFIV
uniref:NADH-ubiquinone oxidoreductase chain 4 n=1 Tax=Ruditapes decussatus TaxID=104385 RepID=A0A219LV72_9BIVA|nr:NADH dehydrogenase subunit 4 [Ruditapes decussatus]AJY78598.1 NADH dehydrogenase subunit 4 [Ruditapes decussatus]